MRLLATFLVLLAPMSYAQFTLQKSADLSGELEVNLHDLCEVSNNTLNYINSHKDDDFAVHQGTVFNDTVTLPRVKKTLELSCELSKKKTMLSMSQLTKYFDFYRWTPDKEQANFLAENSQNKVKKRLLTQIPPDQLFITKYYTKLLDASSVKTEKFNQALYALPYDETELTLEQAVSKKDELTRFAYTRQQVISGVLLQNNLAKPLVWLTEAALHDVLLQGTGVVDVNGKRRYFNVHRNNGIAYDYTLGKTEQARYWYFAEVPSIMGYGKTIESKIAIKPDVTFAGNVKQLGLGKLLLIRYSVDGQPTMQMGVLADQGGAFDNNLFQLDFLKGSYKGWTDYYQANKHLPDYAQTWLLLAK